MQKYEKPLTIALIISYLLIMFLLANITYRNELIENQENKIIDLQIELDSEKEITYQQKLIIEREQKEEKKNV